MNLKELTKEEKQSTLTLMVRSLSEKLTKTNKPYLVIDLTDGEEVVSAKMFDLSLETTPFKISDVITANITSQMYNGTMSFTARLIRVLKDEEYNKSDFIISAPINSNAMYDELINIFNTKISNEDVKNLLLSLYEEYADKLKSNAAATKMHHNYYGGLLYHTYRMVKNAINTCEVYTSANPDLVIAGCALHDIGKIFELPTDEFGVAEYSIDGALFGHLFIGAEIVKNKAKQLKLNNEITRNLVHIICSHHENPEWGAIAKPATKEAFLVSQIDYIDSQYLAFEETCENLEAGELGKSRFGARVYKSKL